MILGNMLLFLFANNTYLASVFYAFMFLLPFWLFTRVLGAVVPVRRVEHPPRAATPSGPGPVIMKPGPKAT